MTLNLVFELPVDLAPFLRYFDGKEDHLHEERRLEEWREKCHQQQIKVIQDKFIYK